MVLKPSGDESCEETATGEDITEITTAPPPPIVLRDDEAVDGEHLDSLGDLRDHDDDESDEALGARVDGRRANSSTLQNCLGDTITRQYEGCTDSELRRLRRRALQRTLRGHPSTTDVSVDISKPTVAVAAINPSFEQRVRELGLTKEQGVELLNSPGGRVAVWGAGLIEDEDARATQEINESVQRRRRIDRILREIGLEQDRGVWETKIFRKNPKLVDGDGPMRAYREWWNGFY